MDRERATQKEKKKKKKKKRKKGGRKRINPRHLWIQTPKNSL
jgi:hypothetical protein